jgi:hypothetical protein
VSIEALKREVQGLGSEARRQLLAFMIALEDEAHPDYARRLAQKIDDRSPGRWLTAEQCERELGLNDGA